MMFGFGEDEEEQMAPIAGAPPVVDDATRKAQVEQYIKDKYKIGQQYSPEARQNLIDQNAKDASGGNWAAGLAALGAGIAGRDATGAGQAILSRQQAARDAKLSNFDKEKQLAMENLESGKKEREDISAQEMMAREKDPNSMESKLAQSMAKKMLPNSEVDFGSLNADQINKMLPSINKLYEAERYKTERNDQRLFQKQMFDEKLAAQKEAAAEKAEEKANPGLKTLDTEFAKDYNQWTSGGKKTALEEIDKLQAVSNNLKNKVVTTGGLTGVLPDRLTSDAVLKARSDVQSTVMNSLREIMGSAFTEKEGERVIKNTWNESDSTENNIERLDRLLRNLKAQAEDKEAKAQYFAKNKKSLRGYGEGVPAATASAPDQKPKKTVVKTLKSPSTGKTKLVYDDGSSEIVDSAVATNGR